MEEQVQEEFQNEPLPTITEDIDNVLPPVEEVKDEAEKTTTGDNSQPVK